MISSVALFAEIPEGLNEFVFLDNPSPNHGCWSKDLTQRLREKELSMPILEPGRVIEVEFQDTILLGPMEAKIKPVLSMALREKDICQQLIF